MEPVKQSEPVSRPGSRGSVAVLEHGQPDAVNGPGRVDTPRHEGEPRHDRWRWRRRIRSNPRQRFIYRIVIGVLGALLVAAGIVTGPLPGPGGIPLVLLGLAVWASEFSWAHRLMTWFKQELRSIRSLPLGRKAAVIACFAVAVLLLGYLGLLVAGVPSWLPRPLAMALSMAPGLGH